MVRGQIEGLNNQRRLADEKRDALDPAARDVRQREPVREAAGHALAAVRDEVGFEIAGGGIVPVRKRTNGYVTSPRRLSPGPRPWSTGRSNGANIRSTVPAR
jgi:hypothetical protein